MFKPYRGLPDAAIKQVQKAYPILKKIQEVTNVPWQAMAGIWYRESFSMASPRTPGGPWQFDPTPSPGVLRGLLDRFTNLTETQKREIMAGGVNTFYTGGVLSACWLRIKTAQVIHPDAPDAAIKDALWGYNGKVQKSADHSPYVMNGFDADHFPMHLVGTLPDGKGGRKKVDILDQRPGAFTIYKQLKALFP